MPDPEQHAARGRDPAVVRRAHAGVLPAAAGGARRAGGLQPGHAVAGAARSGPRRRSCTAPRTRCTSATATSTAGSAPTTPASRAWCSGSSAGTPTPSRTGPASEYEGYMRDVPCPACGGARLKPEILAVTIAGRNIAEVCALSVGDCARLPRRDGAQRPAEDDRRAGAEGDQRAAAVPGRRRAGLPLAGPRRPARCPAARRSGSGSPPRSAPAWSACCTCWTSRASACTSGTTTG